MTSTRRPPAGWIYLAAFVAVGVSLTILGPALSYLRDRAGVSDGDIALLFPASSLGYLVGSLLSGRFYDRGHGNGAVAGGLFGLAAAVLMMPHATSVPALAVVFALIGMCAACVDVGGNTLVVWHTRGSGSSTMINALHLCFGIGALMSPLLVQRSLRLTDGLGLAVSAIAVYSVLVAIVVLLHTTPVHGQHMDRADAPQTPRRILVVVAVFFFLYVGIEVGFSGWLKTYAEGIELPGTDAPTWLNTLFFACFTFGRVLAVPLARFVRPGLMLVGSCALTTVFLLVMSIAGGSPPAVWICTAALGFTMAPQFAAMIAYTEEHIALTGQATSWFVSASGLGGLALPWLIGQLTERSSGAMPVAVFCGAVATTGWLLVVRKVLLDHRGVPPELLPAAPVPDQGFAAER